MNQVNIIREVSRKFYLKWINLPYIFDSSRDYWIERYRCGGNSGNGSYAQLAQFKAKIINEFIQEENIKQVIEYGCGDGNQLSLCNYNSYLGFDISPEAIALCRELFSEDESKRFKMMDDYSGETAELTLSLDVIYHLTEDQVYHNYMNRLFDSSEKYVIIYSSNRDKNSIIEGAHVRHRLFTEWIENRKPDWTLVKHIPNKYPINRSNLNLNNKNGSAADFFIFQKEKNYHLKNSPDLSHPGNDNELTLINESSAAFNHA